MSKPLFEQIQWKYGVKRGVPGDQGLHRKFLKFRILDVKYGYHCEANLSHTYGYLTPDDLYNDLL